MKTDLRAITQVSCLLALASARPGCLPALPEPQTARFLVIAAAMGAIR